MLLQQLIDSNFPSPANVVLSGPPMATIALNSEETLPLARALDCHIMTALLRTRLTSAPSVIDAQLLDHKPGKRALIRYRLAITGQGTAVELFGKIYSQREQLARVDHVMTALWRDLFHAPDSGDLTARPSCGLPQPLGTIPELAMHLYLPAGGEFLDSVLATPEALPAMQLTARWLQRLHGHSLQISKQFDLANELKNLAEWAAIVRQHYPTQGQAVQRLLNSIETQAHSIHLNMTTPIHKDFHYRHVLYNRPQSATLAQQDLAPQVERAATLNVIDFDEVRLGDRNFDLAHFCANLRLLAYRQQGKTDALHQPSFARNESRTIEAQFLRRYAQCNGQTWSTFTEENQGRFRFFYRYSCLKIARQLTLGFGPSPIPVGDKRRQQIQMILEQGNQ